MSELGAPQLLLMIWLLAGVMTFLGVLANAEVASMITETGGQYVYFERMYGAFVAYLYGWAAFAVIQTGTVAALAYVFAEYATQLWPLPELPEPIAGMACHIPLIGDVMPLKEVGVKSLAILVIVFLTSVNYLGVRFGGLMQNIFTMAKLAGMLSLVLLAFLSHGGGNWANLTTASVIVQKSGLALLTGVVAAFQGAFWGYEGWVKASFVAGEVREPQRNVPRAMILAMVIVISVYLLVNIAYCWVLPVDVMAGTKLVAAVAAERLFVGGGKWIAVLVMVSTFGAINAVIMASARVYFAMARRNAFPAFLAHTHPRFHTPTTSLVVQAIWCVALVLSGTFDILTNTLVFVGWAFYAAGAFGVLLLRRKEPNAPRPFKVPGYPMLPLIFVLFAICFLVVTVYDDITSYQVAIAAGKPAVINSAFGMFLVLSGTPIYFLCRYKSRKTTSKASRET